MGCFAPFATKLIFAWYLASYYDATHDAQGETHACLFSLHEIKGFFSEPHTLCILCFVFPGAELLLDVVLKTGSGDSQSEKEEEAVTCLEVRGRVLTAVPRLCRGGSRDLGFRGLMSQPQTSTPFWGVAPLT